MCTAFLLAIGAQTQASQGKWEDLSGLEEVPAEVWELASDRLSDGEVPAQRDEQDAPNAEVQELRAYETTACRAAC